MELTGFIEQHLSREQMAEIADDEFRKMCREYFNANPSVAIGNVIYPAVRELVSEVLGEDADNLIRKKAIEVIEGLSSYTVFHAPNIYDKSPSPSWLLLQRVVTENKDVLEEKIQHHIHNLSKYDALEIIKGSKLTIETNGD